MKFTPTPSASSSFIAGIGLWALFWGILSHLNQVGRVIGLGRFIHQDRILDWMTEHKAMTLMTTEVINLGSHGWGMDALGVTFAMGGTFINAIVIYLMLPLRRGANVLKGWAL